VLRPLNQSNSPWSKLKMIKAKLKKLKLPSKKKELREKVKSLASANVNAGRETKNLRQKAKL